MTATGNAKACLPVPLPTGADQEAATRAKRHLAAAADAEIRRQHREQRFTPLRSAERPAAVRCEQACRELLDAMK